MPEDALATLIKVSAEELHISDSITMEKLKTWLFRYQDLYKYSLKIQHSDSCFKELPCSCSGKKPENMLTCLYSFIQEITSLHQYEIYFGKELETLEQIRHNHQALAIWLRRNEKLGTQDFIEFWLEWYCEESQSIKPSILHWQHLNLSLRVSEWKNTIDFLQKFNSLYY